MHRIGRTGRAGKMGVATTFVMPQERSDARKLERELKIKFDWREADKNLEKEERNRPVDLSVAPMNDLLALETRSWRSGDEAPAASAGRPASSFRSRSGNGGRSHGSSHPAGGGGGRANTHRPGGASRSGPARRGR